ncbi:MAG TPA: polysaccharide deacetylase family protein [Pyrinomonadaceae bacterium]|nr:polysaccharide deacetylase family protein [Pyrinomonadaceae bacterium]
MNRRQFVKDLGLSLAVMGMSGRAAFSSAAAAKPQLAVTMDDFNVFDHPLMTGAARNQAILDALRQFNLRAAMFVAGKYVDNEKNMPLLRAWNDRKHLIGNHTYSHRYYPNIKFEEYTADIVRNETLLKGLPRYRQFFRFPFLKEGKTPEQRDRMRAFLKERGYRNGHVTVDASDWYVDDRLRQKFKADPKTNVKPYGEFYLNHLWERATYYDDLSRKVLGRGVRHTLLIHHNILNGLFLGEVLQMFKSKGWKLIDAEEAFADPIFASEPRIAPAGESLIWALAKETGKFDNLLRYPGEDGDYEKPKMDALGL